MNIPLGFTLKIFWGVFLRFERSRLLYNAEDYVGSSNFRTFLYVLLCLKHSVFLSFESFPGILL